ncbi:Glycosyl hydrolase family 76 [Rosistilla ulvae]|uniref:Glycosyl hydrolase family 76 n=1 Tax=Rosistilla ulvae TaxID=1930277 RepID=A0A517LU24_9BACT|nr:thioredoxin domain-containing protein [Rosistilla ulvae]QDS86124.1 Glycosyl hydrolase family 76 [Rosistilla ulvae]
MTNRLAQSNSPYLLQHQDNPVDWYPWGEEALQRAKDEHKPIFLSIGYAACHWCHVMEHESFEQPRIAELLNDRFVCIKVDREERPDIDQIYMHAVQAMTGQGGWPMSMFLTPEGKPFYGGTYFPPTSRSGMPGFDTIVNAVADAWENKQSDVLCQADQMTNHLQESLQPQPDGKPELFSRWIAAACKAKAETFDAQNGGFGSRPKFPHPMDLELMLRHWHATGEDRWLNIVTVTLSKMADGGIYDHLGGGFARYSVDERWLVPHFEKMLYDNALLAGIYLRGYQATGNQRFAQVARESLEYLIRDMLDPCGAIHCTEDADSEGEEGKYYVWTPDEVVKVLGEARGERFCQIYDITQEGNFEGKNILNLRRPLELIASSQGLDYETLRSKLAEDRQRLLEVRESRVRPGRDDKVLVSWNALAIDALALASGVLGDARMLEVAQGAAEFIWTQMRTDQGRLLHAYRQGTSHLDAYVDDYATLITALVSLFEADGDSKWLARASELADQMLDHFSDTTAGGFFYTADDHESLILRTKDYHDSSVPSGNGEAAYALIRLARLTGNERFEAAANLTLRSAVTVMTEQAMAASRLLIALDICLNPTQQFVLVDPSAESLTKLKSAYFQAYRPRAVLAAEVAIGSEPSRDLTIENLFRGKTAVDGGPTLYQGESFTCKEPATGTAAILDALGSKN